MKSVIFILFTPFFLTAMEKDKSLAACIKDNKQLYLKTFNDSNPVIKQLSAMLKDFKDELNRETAKDPHNTFGRDPLLIKRIRFLEEAKTLIGMCIREIKDLENTITETKEQYEKSNITTQQSMLIYRINSEKLKEVEQKANELQTQIEENKNLLNTQQEQFTRAYSKTLLYRNVFAAGFFISAVGCLGLLYFKK